MDNFGVVEVASQRRAVAPGWAYVPDNSSNSLSAGLAAAMAAAAAAEGAQAGGGAAGAAKNPRKRAARQAAGARSSLALFSDLTSRQETKLRRELELLDRDGGAVAGGGGGREAAIPIPAKAVKAQNKYTPNVRKILASQKTFANHLDDFNAFSALHGSTHGHEHSHGHADTTSNLRDARSTAVSSPAASVGAATPTTRGGGASNRRPTKKDAKQKGGSRRSISAVATPPAPADTPMPDAPSDAPAAPADGSSGNNNRQPTAPSSSILLPYTGPRPPPHPLDSDPLLASAMPPLPTDDELRALVLGPPLTYGEARATVSSADDARRYPTRVFCEICGYWGRVRCTKCGTPVCALDCLELHREDCVTRYGM